MKRRVADAQATAAIRRAANEAGHARTLGTAVTTLEAKRQAAAKAARKEADTAAENRRDDEAEVARKRAVALTRVGSMTANARPRGQLIAPVVGRIVRDWGARTEAGPATGLSFQTPPAARAVAPCGGKVVFADAFRSYGRMVILDCGGGYHAVMAGFERLDVAIGRAVKAGDTVGTMPATPQPRTASRPLLYLELRRDGEPINPAPWLRSRS